MLSEAKAGLTGKVTISSARLISSLFSPHRSRPNRMPVRSFAASLLRSIFAASTGPRTGLSPRARAPWWQDKLRSAMAAARSSKTFVSAITCWALAAAARGLFVRPAFARVDDAQLRQAEIRHGARDHADILAQLRLDKDDGGAAGDLIVRGFGSRHLLLPAD